MSDKEKYTDYAHMERWFEESGSDLKLQPRKDSWSHLERRLGRRKSPVGRITAIAAVMLVLIISAVYLQLSTNDDLSYTALVNASPEAIADLEYEDAATTSYARAWREWNSFLVNGGGIDGGKR